MEGETDDGATGRTIRVLVVDDHELVADSLVRVLSLEDDLVSRWASPRRWPGRGSWWRSRRPDVVLLDQELPDGHGVDAIGDLLAAHPEVQVVMLTASTSESVLGDGDGGRCGRVRLQDQRPRRARRRGPGGLAR